MSKVLFSRGNSTNFDQLATKDENTIYFVEDKNEIYVGNTKYDSGLSTYALSSEIMIPNISWSEGTPPQAVVFLTETALNGKLTNNSQLLVFPTQNSAQEYNFSKVEMTGASAVNNSLTFTCETRPSSNLTVNVIKLG